jgi:hypothetical protein
MAWFVSGFWVLATIRCVDQEQNMDIPWGGAFQRKLPFEIDNLPVPDNK